MVEFALENALPISHGLALPISHGLALPISHGLALPISHGLAILRDRTVMHFTITISLGRYT